MLGPVNPNIESVPNWFEGLERGVEVTVEIEWGPEGMDDMDWDLK